MTTLRRGVLLCLLLAGTAGCDRVTKHLAVTTLAGMPGQSYLGDTVRLDYHENPGGFLSTGATWRPETRAVIFQLANGIFLFGTLLFAVHYQWSRLAAAGLMLFVAGGLSNLIDRVAMGTVIDFMNVGIGPWRTGIFNVADVAIMAGVALLLLERGFAKRAAV
jgi:signal peptidase II